MFNMKISLHSWPLFASSSSGLSPEFIERIKLCYVFGGGDKAFFITKDDNVYAYGENSTGILGTGNRENCPIPKRIDNLCGRKIKHFVSGVDHVFALSESGETYSTARDLSKILRNNGIGEKIKHISTGKYYHLVLCKDEKTLFDWGKMDSQDSTLNTKRYRVPNESWNNKKVLQIVCGSESAFVVTELGEIYSWGANRFGELGLGHNNREMNPTKIFVDGVFVKSVAAGKHHTLALCHNGVVYGWGSNELGQVGTFNSSLNMIWTPSKVVFSTKRKRIIDVAAVHLCDVSAAMDEEGKVYAWGFVRGQKYVHPFLTNFNSLHEVFAHYANPAVTYTPLQFNGSNKAPVSESVKHAFNDEETADLIITVEGKQIKVHKTLLMVRSEYFKKMFQNGCWKENKEKILEIKNRKYEAYYALLKYLYTDEVNVPFGAAFELYGLAREQCEDHLKKHTVKLIKQNIKIENALASYVTSNNMRIEELTKFCLNFILKNLTLVTLSEEYKNLDGETAKRIFKEAASRKTVFRT